jgi:hypothetical protein
MGNQTNADDDWELDTEDILDKAKSKSVTGFFAFIALLLLLLYFFRKRDWRMRLYSRVNSILRRRRPGTGGRKGSAGARGLSGLATKIFGGSRRGSGGATYERVMEEGDASQFELGDVDSDDTNEYSDSSDALSSSSKSAASSRRFGLSSGLATPQVVDHHHHHHYHHGLASPTVSALDRSGLVVRTESRERLTLPPHLALSGVGRRSRAGSPTRMKSPLMSPLQET